MESLFTFILSLQSSLRTFGFSDDLSPGFIEILSFGVSAPVGVVGVFFTVVGVIVEGRPGDEDRDDERDIDAELLSLVLTDEVGDVFCRSPPSIK